MADPNSACAVNTLFLIGVTEVCLLDKIAFSYIRSGIELLKVP